MNLFERWLMLWAFLCIVAGIAVRPVPAGAVPGPRPHGGGAGESPGRPAHPGDDRADAGEGGQRRQGPVRARLMLGFLPNGDYL